MRHQRIGKIVKKYDNESIYIKDWTTKKLKEEAKGYYATIFITECYGRSDLRLYYSILNELDKRNIKYHEELTF